MKTKKKIDERLLGLPHSSLSQISLSKINLSLEKIEDFSSDLAIKDGIVGVLGRAVLLRAKQIRQSLKTETKAKKTSIIKPQSKNRATRAQIKVRASKRNQVQVAVRAKKPKAK